MSHVSLIIEKALAAGLSTLVQLSPDQWDETVESMLSNFEILSF